MSPADDGSVSLTFAEMEYLLTETAGWPATRRVFGLQPLGDEGMAAGLSSLAIRRLLTWTRDTAEVVENVRRAAGALSAVEVWLTAVFRTPAWISTSYLGASADHSLRVLVSATAPGCFRLDALESEPALAQQAAQLVNDVLSDDLPSMVVLNPTDDALGRLTIGRDHAGDWFIGSAPPSAAAHDFDAVAEPDAQNALSGFLVNLYGA